jgi:translation elongation factor EF-4
MEDIETLQGLSVHMAENSNRIHELIDKVFKNMNDRGYTYDNEKATMIAARLNEIGEGAVILGAKMGLESAKETLARMIKLQESAVEVVEYVNGIDSEDADPEKVTQELNNILKEKGLKTRAKATKICGELSIDPEYKKKDGKDKDFRYI